MASKSGTLVKVVILPLLASLSWKQLEIDWQFANRNCYSVSRVSWASAQISCLCQCVSCAVMNTWGVLVSTNFDFFVSPMFANVEFCQFYIQYYFCSLYLSFHHHSFIPISKLLFFSNPILHRHLAPPWTDSTAIRTRSRFYVYCYSFQFLSEF